MRKRVGDTTVLRGYLLDIDLKSLIGIAIKIVIITLMVAMGLQMTKQSLVALWCRPKLLAGSLVAAFIVVPVVTYLIFQFVPLAFSCKVGLWVVAITPGAPMIHNAASRRELSDPELAASFQVTVALLVIVFAPLWLAIISVLTGSDYQMNPLMVMKQVSIIQLIPILIGLAIRHFGKESAHRAGEIIARFGFFVLAVLGLMVLFAFAGHIIRNMEIWKFIATGLIAISAVTGGHLFAGPDTKSRVTIANANAMRNPGLALAVVAWNFPEQKPAAIIIIVVYIIVAAVVAAIYTKLIARRLPSSGRDHHE
ncbi:MAG: hypothetical protein NT018_14700 [Armatimonadetes bacterium]|nr:hypothetical protein [Armatimonadota bacterium]